MVRECCPVFLILSLEFKCQLITTEHCGFWKFTSFLLTTNSDTRKYTTTISNGKTRDSGEGFLASNRSRRKPPPAQRPTLSPGHRAPKVSKRSFVSHFCQNIHLSREFHNAALFPSNYHSLTVLYITVPFTTFCARSLHFLCLTSQILNPMWSGFTSMKLFFFNQITLVF